MYSSALNAAMSVKMAWSSYSGITWHNNHLYRSGNVLPEDCWPIRTSRSCVCIKHLREWQHMIGSHHATKALQPITNLQFILYVAQVGGGCLNTRRRPTLGISSRLLFLFLCVSFCFFAGVRVHTSWIGCQNCKRVILSYNSYHLLSIKT